MTKAKTTKRALLMSVLSMLLCVSMLVGSTFAWFTDSVTSGNNKIVAGNLSVDLVHVGGGENGEDVSIKGDPNHRIFDYDKWEPGYTTLATLKVENKGTLALQYKLNVLIKGADEVTNDKGEKTTLADVIDVYVYYGSDYAKPASFAAITAEGSGWQKAGTLATFMADPNKAMASGNLLPEKAESKNDEPIGFVQMTVALHMQELAGNEYQGRSLGDMSLILSAAQYTYEEDSFGDQYDADARLPDVPDVVVSSSADLLTAMSNADNGDTIALTGGTYSLGSQMVTYTGKEFTLIAMDDEKVTIEGRLAFVGSSKVSIYNIDLKADGPMLVEGNTEFNMYGGSLTSVSDSRAAFSTNGSGTRDAKIVLDGVHLVSKKRNGTDSCAIYAPGQADYFLKDCIIDGYAIFCAGNVVIEGGSITYNKPFSIQGDTDNTNSEYLYEEKQFYDREEAAACLKKIVSGAAGLGDALQFDGNRGGGYEKLERVEIRNMKIAATSLQDTDYVFGIRYIESLVEGDMHETVFVLENIDTTTYNLP